MARAKPKKARAQKRLARYRERRRFDVTPEPKGRAAARGRGAAPGFVVQKHAARNLHYDFRLEHGGVLLSWSVPKGPSLSPSDRRLAVRTEDHPLEYADFEGVIPKGEYGAGAVIVWDRGRWTPEGDAEDALRRGRLTFTLDGEKLRGRWHLIRTNLDGKRENWLLFKARDAEARASDGIVETRPESAISGRSIEQVAAAKGRVWHSNRPAAGMRKLRSKRLAKAIAKHEQRQAARPAPSAADLAASLPVQVPFTNLDKVLFPEQNLTKGALLAYYSLVAEWALPHLSERPLTLVRCPDGRHRHCFYQKHAKPGVPSVVGRVEIEEEDGERESYMTVRDLSGLLALVQLGALEIHTWAGHADALERPDQLILDVDPDEGMAFERVIEAAQELRRRLGDLGLESFVKTTGGKGLHVVAPVKRRLGWDEHLAFARGVVGALEREQPRLYTTNSRKAARKGRLFLDYLRNARGATAVAPYSTRAREGAPVATPLAWSELEQPLDPARFTVFTVPERLAGLDEDPWSAYFELSQSIAAAARRKVER
jgi:bifunctional non-homologous end joining protein LigD